MEEEIGLAGAGVSEEGKMKLVLLGMETTAVVRMKGRCWVTLQELQANRKEQVPSTSSGLLVSQSSFSAPY